MHRNVNQKKSKITQIFIALSTLETTSNEHRTADEYDSAYQPVL